VIRSAATEKRVMNEKGAMTAAEGTGPDRAEATTGRRWFAIGALSAGGLAILAIALGGIGDNLVYYWGPTELRTAGAGAYGATIRLGGLVAPGSVRYAGDSSLLEFDVTDAKTVVHVRSKGVPPQMFREGIGVVVEGTMTRDDYFDSDRLMVKHGNDYQAPRDGSPIDARALIESAEAVGSAAKP
jgi:cytochrome c-type biogenesis protein CcmE